MVFMPSPVQTGAYQNQCLGSFVTNGARGVRAPSGGGGEPKRDSRSCHKHNENWRPDRVPAQRRIYKALQFFHSGGPSTTLLQKLEPESKLSLRKI
jgi:hypothetical protein